MGCNLHLIGVVDPLRCQLSPKIPLGRPHFVFSPNEKRQRRKKCNGQQYSNSMNINSINNSSLIAHHFSQMRYWCCYEWVVPICKTSRNDDLIYLSFHYIFACRIIPCFVWSRQLIGRCRVRVRNVCVCVCKTLSAFNAIHIRIRASLLNH